MSATPPVPTRPQRVLLITGMSGAGKSTVLKALEDLDFEAVDNAPLSLLPALLDAGTHDERIRNLAVGVDARTRRFDAAAIVDRVRTLRAEGHDIRTVFLDCAGHELVRRFSETRRRHPLAYDRPAGDGVAREREILGPLRQWADVVDRHDRQLDQRSAPDGRHPLRPARGGDADAHHHVVWFRPRAAA